MKLEKLNKMLDAENPVLFAGECCDCQWAVTVKASRDDQNEIAIEGGAVFRPPESWNCPTEFLFKCQPCFDKNHTFSPRTEVYSRCVGYLRPVNQWNNGKRAEWKSRKTFAVESMNAYP